MALMAVVHAAHPKFWRNAVRKSGTGPDHFLKPIVRCDDGSPTSSESAASPTSFYSQSNIDQRIGNLKTKPAQRNWSRQAMTGDQARSARAYSGSIMISSPLKRTFAQSAQSHDWDTRATEVIAEVHKMLCLSEIKLAHTDDEVRQEMA
jgi:hypothetical protein